MRDLPPRTQTGEGRSPAPGSVVPSVDRSGPSADAAGGPGTRRRLDAELVRRGLARSRTHAARLVADGLVSRTGLVLNRPAHPVLEADELTVDHVVPDWASRAGGKLDAALDHFAGVGDGTGRPPGVAVEGRRCLDAGASTGGFTDVLLRRGARSVIAVDVGTGQLRRELAEDRRVDVRESTDVRDLGPAELPGGPVDLTVADLSFISLTKVMPALSGLTAPDGDLVLLVKPQFEVGRADVGRGVVADPRLWRRAVEEVAAGAAGQGWGVVSEVASTVPGRAGNREFLLWLRRVRQSGPAQTDGRGATT